MSQSVNNQATKPEQVKLTHEQQIRNMGLDTSTMNKMLKAIGVDVPVEPFTRYDFTPPVDKNGKQPADIPMISINVGKKTKGITLWMAEAILANPEAFAKLFEQIKSEVKIENEEKIGKK